MLPDLSRHGGDRNLAAMRLLKQRLVGAPFASPADVVDALVAVQSQDYGGACWGVSQRCGAPRADIQAAFDRGDLLRTHVLRPTWHFVRPADLRWLLALTAPRVLAASRPYFAKFELDAPVLRRTDRVVAKRLEEGFATRDELAAALGRAKIEASGTRLAYLLIHAELTGLIVSGPRVGKQFTYALVEQRAALASPEPELDRRDAVVRLARRYFAVHGPATVHDFAWWSGLTVADARLGAEALGAGFSGLMTSGKTYHFGDTTERCDDAPVAHLLPNYDELLIAYKDHGVAYDPSLAPSPAPRSVPFSNHSVVMNGLVIGAWRREGVGKKSRIEHQPWVKLDRRGKAALDAAIERAASFFAV